MNFQDSLKSYSKTKEEIYEGKLERERQWDISYAETCTSNIEKEFLNMAARGDYVLIGGKKIIKSLFALNKDSPYLEKTRNFPEDKRYLHDNDKATIQYNERHSFFIKTLKERLAEDDIYITREYLAQERFNNHKRDGGLLLPIAEWGTRGYPAVFQGYDATLIADHTRIVIECQTAIPEEYSEEFISAERARAEKIRKAEEERKVAEEQRAEEARKAEAERKAAEARMAEERRKAEEERIAEEERKAEIQRKILQRAGDFDNMEGHQFEAFCAELLLKNGFTDVEKTQGSGDQGVDIIAFKDGVKFGIQCKCYSSDVGNKAVQEVFTGKAYYRCNVAVILTNRYFTQYARELAQMNGVVLWDRDKLLEFIENVDK